MSTSETWGRRESTKLSMSRPAVALIVSESGIDTPEDIRRLDRAGARAFLIGESLLRDSDPRRKLEALGSALMRREG